MAQNLFQPIYLGINNILASISENIDSYAFYHSNVWIRSIPTFVIASVTFIVIFVLAWRNGRTYCNTICPVGTVLGFFARFSWFKIHFDTEKCRNCSLCSKNCKAACIDYNTHSVDYSRCVTCGNCLEKCKFGALSYSHGKSHSENATPNTPDRSKRSFLLASAMLTTAAWAQKEKTVDGD